MAVELVVNWTAFAREEVPVAPSTRVFLYSPAGKQLVRGIGT